MQDCIPQGQSTTVSMASSNHYCNLFVLQWLGRSDLCTNDVSIIQKALVIGQKCRAKSSSRPCRSAWTAIPSMIW